MKKSNILYAIALVLLVLTSCSKGNYVNNLPRNAVGLLAVNGGKLVGAYSPFKVLLTPFVNEDRTQMKGIDLTKDLYFYETSDGIFGICAPIADDYEFHDFVSRLSNIGGLSDIKTQGDIHYCFYKNQWALAYNEYCMLVMGPVMDNDKEREKIVKRMIAQMDDEEETSCQGTELWQHLNESTAPVRFVARASALPEQMVSTCTFGAPVGTDPDDVLIEAAMTYKDGTLYMDGTTCSSNQHILQTLRKSIAMYRPISIDWEKAIDEKALSTIFINAKGKDLISTINKNKTLSSLLMSTGAYDEISNSNGNMVITIRPRGSNIMEQGVTADVKVLPNANKKNKERLVAVFNTESLLQNLTINIFSSLNKIKRVVFIIDD